MTPLIVGLGVCGVVVAVDAALVRVARRRAFSPWWGWTFVTNPGTIGGAFGGQRSLLTMIAVLTALLGLAWLLATGSPCAPATGAVMGGALSNARHRARYGVVIDYFSVPGSRWAFNIGDIALTAGFVALSLA